MVALCSEQWTFKLGFIHNLGVSCDVGMSQMHG